MMITTVFVPTEQALPLLTGLIGRLGSAFKVTMVGKQATVAFHHGRCAILADETGLRIRIAAPPKEMGAHQRMVADELNRLAGRGGRLVFVWKTET